MDTQNNKQENNFPQWIAPALLFLSGIVLIAGYNMHMTGFFGLVTLIIAGASLFVSGGLWGASQRAAFAMLALGVIVLGVVMCTPVLFAQVGSGDFLAAFTNLFVISSQIVAGFLIVQSHTSLLRHR